MSTVKFTPRWQLTLGYAAEKEPFVSVGGLTWDGTGIGISGGVEDQDVLVGPGTCSEERWLVTPAGAVLKRYHGFDIPPSAPTDTSPDGTRAADIDDDFVLSITDVRSDEILSLGQLPPQPLPRGRQLYDFRRTWSPDMWFVASACAGATVRVWHAATGEEVARMVGALCGRAEILAWSPAGDALAGGVWAPAWRSCCEYSLRVWDLDGLAAWEPRDAPPADEGVRWLESAGCTGVSLSPDGATLLTAHDDLRLRRWDVARGEVTWEGHLRSEHQRPDILWSPTGAAFAAIAGRIIAVWDVDTGTLAWHESSTELTRATWCGPDRLALVRHARITVHDSTTGGIVRSLELGASVDAEGAPDGRLAVGNGRWMGVVDAGGERTWGRKWPYTAYHKMRWSPDGTRIASTLGESGVAIVRAATGSHVELRGHDHEIESMAWTPDSQVLVTASRDQRITAWDGSTGVVLGSLDYPESYPKQLAVAPGLVVSTGAGSAFPVWRVTSHSRDD